MTDAYEKVFIKQVFYGCIRYQDFLKIFIRQFYKHHPNLKTIDAPMFSIFVYIVIFRLGEVTP